MKKFQFKTQESIIKGIEEKPIKKGFNWDRVIYFAVLLIVLVSFGSYFISQNIRVTAESEVLMDKFNVTFTNDVIVTEFFVEESDSVSRGDSLFTYLLSREYDGAGGRFGGASGSAAGGYSGDTENWLIREKLKAERDAQKARLEIRSLKKDIEEAEGSIEKIRKQVFLDVYPPSKLTEVQRDIRNNKSKLAEKEDELAYHLKYIRDTQQRLDVLRAQKPEFESFESGNVGTATGFSDGRGRVRPDQYTYLSPKNGMVSQIYARSDEVRYKSTLVMDIVEFQGLHILSYFRQKDLKYISPGDKVDIKFPDGSNSVGIIDKTYIKTASMPDRLYRKGSKVEQRVRAVVVPINVEEASKWFNYYKINVMVSKPKYF